MSKENSGSKEGNEKNTAGHESSSNPMDSVKTRPVPTKLQYDHNDAKNKTENKH